MDLSYSEEQQHLREVIGALLDKHATPGHVRDAEPLGFDPDLWTRLCDVGLVGMGVSEGAGGTGAGLLEIALVAEACGRSTAPVPFVEASVAARALAAATGDLTALLDGAPVTFAPRAAVGGCATLVPHGAVARHVVALDGAQLVAVVSTPPGVSPPNIGCNALADVPLRRDLGADGVTVLASGADAKARFDHAVEEWMALMAAALTGLAAQALRLAVDYVKERKQFGVAIGSFQTVSHRLADVATEVDGSTLLWQEASWALDEREPTAAALARMAFVFAAEVAERAALTSLHLHGGYGFMLEYDIQLLARRAKAWPLGLGSRATAVALLADALYGELSEA